MGGGNVRYRHGHSLAADQLEKAVPSGVQRYAALADGDSSLCCHRHNIPVRLCRNATLHIFPVLMKSTEYRVQSTDQISLGQTRKRSVSETVCQQSGLSGEAGLPAIIGITGGIGSGKSTIARELVKRGFAVYDCDREAKRIIAENKDVQQQIINLFGEKSFVNGVYNTQYISKCVFSPSLQGRSGEALLAQLNAIIHPAVGLDIMKRQPDFVESAILFESGLNLLCHRIIVIDAPEDIRIARTIARDYHGDASPANINKVRARIHAQHIPQGDLTLLNDGHTPIPELVDEILAVY